MDPVGAGGSEKFRLFQKDDFEADWLKVGERTFGRVYKVKLKLWREVCAMKRFCSSLAQTSSYREVIAKVSKMSEVRFKYIVSVYGACSDPPAVVMEFMTSGSLESLLSSHELMWPKKFLMIHEITMGMNFLHSTNPPLLHLNLKLANVLLDHHLHVKISDFGLIKWEEFSNRTEFIEHLTMRGNLSYIPPETFTESCDPPGTKFDVYSFSIVMWEILTQKKAFPGANMMTVLMKVSSGKRPNVEKLPDDKPQESEAMIDIMQRCWQQKSSDRPPFSDTVRETEALSEGLKFPDVLHACKDVYRPHKLPYTTVFSLNKEPRTKMNPDSGGGVSQRSVDFLSKKDFENFKRSLKREDVLEVYEENYSLLHYTVASGDAEAVELVLQQGAAVDSQNDRGYTPLVIGVLRQLYDVCALLVQRGADVSLGDADRWTPLHFAAQNGDDRIARLLLEHGAGADAAEKDGWTPLHLAAQNGHENVVRILLPRSAAPDAQEKDGRTALHMASSYGHLVIVKLLLSQGADPNWAESGGSHALHLAAEEGHFRVVRLLLESGAETDRADGRSYSALHWAALKGHAGICRLLLSRGAEPNPRTQQGWTPLHLVALKGHDALVPLLEEHRADVDAAGDNGWTPLHLSCHHGLPEVTSALLTVGARPDPAEDSGWTPLHLASHAGCFSSVLHLIARGAQVNAQNGSRATPLHLAAASGAVAIVEALLLNGARLDVKDAGGCTARELAEKWHKHEVVQALDGASR
ncbi:ankyrin repeat and protein kinase domain-containing protein 1 isoform X2 [Anguilla anguilla]|nr:ankyrin repeat and protein kinase domain-containing protein 1 isoform X2 [Anguilla anguilla]